MVAPPCAGTTVTDSDGDCVENFFGGLTYSRSFLFEALRLHPPFWIVSRRVEAPHLDIEHWRVRGGTTLILSPYVTHRLPQVWQDPLRFDPSRFEPKRRRNQHALSWWPFGAGPRRCVGQRMAIAHLTLALSRFARTFHVRVSGDVEVGYDPALQLLPRMGLPLSFERSPPLH